MDLLREYHMWLMKSEYRHGDTDTTHGHRDTTQLKNIKHGDTTCIYILFSNFQLIHCQLTHKWI